MRFKPFLAAIAAIVSIRAAQAQDAGLKLDDLLAEALQHNREILGGLLGVSDAELDELAAAGVIGTRPTGL